MSVLHFLNGSKNRFGSFFSTKKEEKNIPLAFIVAQNIKTSITSGGNEYRKITGCHDAINAKFYLYSRDCGCDRAELRVRTHTLCDIVQWIWMDLIGLSLSPFKTHWLWFLLEKRLVLFINNLDTWFFYFNNQQTTNTHANSSPRPTRTYHHNE